MKQKILYSIIIIFVAIAIMNIIVEKKCIANSLSNNLVIVIDSVPIDKITDSKYTNINYLINKGSIGLINIRSAGSLTRANSYITFGAGKRAIGDMNSYNGYNRYEVFKKNLTAEKIYTLRTDNKINGEIINPNITYLTNINKKSQYKAQVGNLGESLKDNNIIRGVIGNGDIYSQFNRGIVSVFMDTKGTIEKGLVNKELLVKDQYFPTGYRTNYNKLYEEYIKLKKKLIL